MKRTRTFLPFVLFIGLSATALAQVPRQMSYQGVVANGSGTPLQGTHALTIKIYDNTGTTIYTETQNAAFTNGLFNVVIGGTSAIPGTILFNAQYTIGVAVDGGAELVPRTPLTSSPYSLNAAQAMSLAPGATGAVTSLNTIGGDITLVGAGSTTVNRSGNTITISSTGGGGSTGIGGVQSSDGSLTITQANGPIANLEVTDGGITSTKLANNSVTAAKISSLGAASGQVLGFNGTNVVWTTPGTFALPYSGTINTAVDAFSVTNSGTGRAGFFKNSNGTPLTSALYGESNATSSSLTVAGVEGKSTNGFGIIGTGGGASSGIFGRVITGPTAGAFFAGTGVTGFSDAGHGVAGITYNATNSGVFGTATGTGWGVRGASTAGVAGLFEITTAANTNNALEGATNGSGNGIYGKNTAATGSTSGVLGEVFSSANGIGANGGVTGVLGRVNPTSPGGYSAGVRGVNNGTGGTGIGVIGYQAGSGWGVYGETPSGFGVYGLTTNTTAVSSGVRGETFSTNGIGVEAKYSGAGVGIALEVDNGAIRVAGVNKAAFVHTTTAANKLSANGTDVDNPLCNGDPNALLFVTQKLNPSGIIYNNSPIGVYYNTIRNKWEIFNEANTAVPVGAQFNVLVIKQ
ncbi:MAG: hypothetical protein JWQ98_1154 [Chlorobi bacterium]|nr:hypothetical protein [Chlorobiota bacterium]